jgi:deoxyribodipyrimidine photo-lyase
MTGSDHLIHKAAMTNPVLFWFRDDLRLSDNPALSSAVLSGHPVHFIYIVDKSGNHARALGAAQRWWLHHSLKALAEKIGSLGGRLELYQGDPSEVLPAIVSAIQPSAIFWNRRYDRASVACDASLKTYFDEQAIPVRSFNGSLLREPWEVTSKTGTPMKVFTPFLRAARLNFSVPAPAQGPSKLNSSAKQTVDPLPKSLDELHLLPTNPDWSMGMALEWQPGEAGALKTLDTFLDGGFSGYAENRNRPDLPSTSRLSPYLRFGEISIRKIWHSAEAAVHSGRTSASAEDLRVFESELGWREFSYHLLYHQPDISTINVQRSFDAFEWLDDPSMLKAWKRGKTGYPLVDAGMRELWQTGFMHNRVRMVVASFLIKHLRINWRIGEAWFWDTLLDADPANNPASWQWVAGSGADAAPYYRIFNPMLQSEKFDPDGIYIRKFVPELSKLPNALIHSPWLAKPAELAFAGVRLGDTYPYPIVNHDEARNTALKSYKALKESA